jgi:phage-related minor tail protein
MDEQIEQLVIGVRADTQGFARDVATMRGQLEGPLADGAGRAGRSIESALARAITSGKTGFDDLRKIAVSALEQIAAASLRSLLQPSGGSDSGGGLLGSLSGLVSGLLGSPGRATGGPVSGGRPYMVGENGPELFVPSSSGRIERMGATGRGVNVSIAVTTPTPSDPQALRQSSSQVARAVRSAIRRGGQ